MKCIVRDGELVLFVRHTYGDRRAWELPGGHVRRSEDAEAAVRREVLEELGLDLAGLVEVGRADVEGSHKRTTLVCFSGRASGPLRLDAGEIAEARWAPLQDPPQPLGPDAGTLLELMGGGS